ncbi:MAG: tetratricopeptide repeat protein [bacterium]|nr:tetratricopeptide repeat protein [bacterium]
MKNFLHSFFLLGCVAVIGAATSFAQAKRSITVVTEPNARVWINGVLYGTTDENGKLEIKTVPPGRRTLRILAPNFAEVNRPLPPTQRGEIKIALIETRDPAELAFHEGERQATLDRAKAEAAYRKAIAANPKLISAHVGLLRNLAEGRSYEKALVALRELRKVSPRNAEASAIEGRIHKDLGDEAKAIASFKRAIAEGGGFQPEAYAGLGLLYQSRAEVLGDDVDQQRAAYNEAAKNLKTAVEQLSGAPDAATIYQLIGMIYEEQKRYKEAIALYEDFLKTFPDSAEAEAVRSFIVQIKKEMAIQQ